MRKIQIGDSFLLMLSILFFADSDGTLFLFLLAAVLHEVGHYIALRLCGGAFLCIRLSAAGAVMRYRIGEKPLRRCLVAFAGPFTSLIAAYIAARQGFFSFSGASALLGFFNLLPIMPLDGGVILFWALRRFDNGVAHILSGATAALLAVFGAAILFAGGGATLLGISCFLLILQKNLPKT